MANFFGPPNVKWCENTICAWINEPANAWSNLGYIVLAFYLWQKNTKNLENQYLKLFPLTLFLTGFFSFIYHSTNNFFTQVFDFLGMYSFTYLLILLSLKRFQKILTFKKFIKIYLVLIILTVFLTIFFDKNNIPIQSIIGVHILIIIGLEIFYRMRDKNYSLKYFFTSMILIFVAASFSFVDVKRIWCDPHNHIIQGHGLWHVFSALSLYFMYFHAFQFLSNNQES
jgi:hypothetical protein